jgi:hypothetical protein
LAGYLSVWVGFAALLAILLHLPGTLDWSEAFLLAAPICLLYAFVCLTPWYMCHNLPLFSAKPLKIILNHGSAAVVTTAGMILMARGIALFLDLGPRFQPAQPMLVALGLLWYLFSVALHYLMLAIDDSRRAAVEAREAELRALKAQIHPHFLFNSLNSIAALVAVKPEEARSMCALLSDFLRTTLGMSERSSIPLREELELAHRYLAVERVRFGDRLTVSESVDASTLDVAVPPLLLQPLFENAVKHGIGARLEGGVLSLVTKRSGGRVSIVVENPAEAGVEKPAGTGLGLANVRRRVAACWGDAGYVGARLHDGLFRVEIELPADA